MKMKTTYSPALLAASGTLSGEASSQSQKELATEYAEDVVTLSGIAKKSAEKRLVTKLVTDIEGVDKVIHNMTALSLTLRDPNLVWLARREIVV